MTNAKLKALLWADAIWFFGEGMLGPLFAVFGEKVGGNVLDIAWAWAVYLLVTGIIMILVGRIAKGRVMAEKLVFLGYALNAICTFLYLFVSNPTRLFIVQAGLGVAAALATPTWNTLYAQGAHKEKDSSLWGLADGMSSICTGLAIIAGGLVVTYYSFTALFVVMGCTQVISTVVLLPVLKLDLKLEAKHRYPAG